MKKGMFSKIIVSFVILINILFTIGVLYIFLKTGSEPTALISAWFAFTTVEVWQLAKIKRARDVKTACTAKSEKNDSFL